MEIPGWLRTETGGESQLSSSQVTRDMFHRKNDELFVDRTLRRALSFIEDSMFNDMLAAKNGFLQKIEPRLKIVTLFLFIITLSFQRSIESILIFAVLALSLVIASRISLRFFFRKLLPAAAITLCISLPVLLNVIVAGDPLIVIFRFGGPPNTGSAALPNGLFITEQGLKSALTLLFRVIVSVSFVFLIIMTTRPNTFMKSVSFFIPGPLNAAVSISYRYIFFLVRKTEQFIMGLKSRQISPVKALRGQHWAASRIGSLFSVSMELNANLAMAMESRGYREERFGIRGSNFRSVDVIWLLLTLLLCLVMIWKSLK